MFTFPDWDYPSPHGSKQEPTSQKVTFRLRPYQVEADQKIEEGWQGRQSQLLVMATGTGKTVVISNVVKRFLADGKKCLVLAHMGELLEQAGDKISAVTGVRPALEKADSFAKPADRIVLASWQTLFQDSRLHGFKPEHFDLVVVDEAHRSESKGYRKIIEYFNKGKLLGVTATPDRGDKKSLSNTYEAIAYEYGLRDACRDGWLVRPMAKTLPIKIDLKSVEKNRDSDGDISKEAMGHAIEPFIDILAEAIVKEAPKRKHMIFMPTVNSAELMAIAMERLGMESDYVSGDMKDRDDKIARFKQGKLQALTNCSLLIEGFDHDAIDCITVLRATKIRGLLAQCVGRGTRPLNSIVGALNDAPDAMTRRDIISKSQKPNLLILDPLWLTTKLDLAKAAELLAPNDAIAKRMKDVQGDLMEAEEQAERDLIESLKKELAKHSRKKSQLIDPLRFSELCHDPAIAIYEPATQWEAQEPSQGQKDLLKQFGIAADAIKYRGQAKIILDKVLQRRKEGKALPRQVLFWQRQGIDASDWTAEAASRKMKEKIAYWKSRRGSKQEELQILNETK